MHATASDRGGEWDGVLVRRPLLSKRETEVLRVWLQHDSKADAARSLYVTEATVNTHIIRIRNKYASVDRPARTKMALLARALQDGLVNLDDW